MCINCNIPLPVAQYIIEKHGLPNGTLMTNRELASIVNPYIRGGGLMALISGDAPDDAFEPGLDKYNYESIHLYDWILDEKVSTKYGLIKSGRIVPRNVDDIPADPLPFKEINRVWKQMDS